MNAPSVDIKDFLVNAGIGTFGTDLFVSKEPESPNACVTVYDTGGFDAEAAYTYDRPTVQVRVRGDKQDYSDAFTKAQSVRDELHGKYNETINGTRYVGIWIQGDIFTLGYDANDRPILAVNFRMHRTT
jgi:hypothetical protein